MVGVTQAAVTNDSVAADVVTFDKVTGGVVSVAPINTWVQKDLQPNPESVGGGQRLDVFWKADGTRVWTCRDSSNRCDQTNVSPAFSILAADWTGRIGDIVNFNDPRSLWVIPDGTRMINSYGTTPHFRQFDMSPAFTIAGMVAAGTKVVANILDTYWSVDGFTVWIYRSSTNNIDELAVSVAYDVTTINTTPVKSKNLLADVGATIRSFTFSDDGTQLYMITAGRNLAEYPLSTPFDISTTGAFILGPQIATSSDVNIPRGLFFRPTDGFLIIFGDQGTTDDATIYGPP